MNRALVVGGGIGGLTTAIALRRVGAEVALIEKAPSFSQVGAGITVQANAHAIFRALGIELDPEDTISIGKVEMINGAGQVLLSGDSTELPVDEPSVNIHRADLHRNLLRVAEGIPLRTGLALVGLEVGAQGVQVELSDGSQESWDVVIGADGIHSTARRLLLGDKGSATRYSGQTCWRFACEAPGGEVPDVTRELWRPGKRIGAVPLSRGRLYIYMVNSAPQGTPKPGSEHPDVLRELFGNWHPEVDAVLDGLDDGVAIHHGDLLEHRQVAYGRGRVVLLGDAAHAMTPNMGQGAGMAIEDAAALALLWGQVEPGQLAESLSARRKDRAQEVTKMSWRIGSMAHWRFAPLAWLRDWFLRRMTPEQIDQQALEMWGPGIQLAKELRRQLPSP